MSATFKRSLTWVVKKMDIFMNVKEVMGYLWFLVLLAIWMLGGFLFVHFDGDIIKLFGLFDAVGWLAGLHFLYMFAFLATWMALGITLLLLYRFYSLLKR